MQIKKIIKDALALFAITIISGLLLGGVYEITKGPIKEEGERAKQEAYQTVFKDAKVFKANKDLTKKAESASKDILAKEDLESVTIDEVLEAKDESGAVIGNVMSVTSPEGYGGNITISIGIQADGKVTGMEILKINETAGLGMKAKDAEFKNQFADKTVEKFEYTKTGEKGDNKIDALSGATITTSAVMGAVNAAICFANSVSTNN